MDAVNPFSEDNPLVFDIKLEEDIEAELEDFILLTRLGVHREAKEIYHEVLKEHQNLFPVFAELAGFFVELGEMNQLSALLEDLGPTGATFDNSDRRELLSLLSSFAKADVRPTESYKTYLDQWILYLVIHFERRDSKTGRLHALSSAQIQSGEILCTAASRTSSDSEGLNNYGRRQLKNLLERGLFWEAIQIFAILADDPVAERPVEHLLSSSEILETYDLIQVRLPKDGDIDSMLCDLKAKYVCLNTIKYRERYKNKTPKLSADRQVIDYLHEEIPLQMKELMNNLFRELPDPRPRGIYEDFLCSEREYREALRLRSRKNTRSARSNLISRKDNADSGYGQSIVSEDVQSRDVTDYITPQYKATHLLATSGRTDQSEDVCGPRTTLVEDQKASDSGPQTIVRTRPKKGPPQIIDEPHFNHVLPEPNEISCTLIVSYNNNDSRILDNSSQYEPFRWTLWATYRRLIAKIENVQKTLRVAELGSTVHLYYGAFRIIGQDHEYSQEIKALTQLEEVTIQSICGFVYKHPKQRFRLEYFFDYSSYRTLPGMGEKYSEMVRNELWILKSKTKNFNNQMFIPRNHRDQFASKKIISAIISEELKLGPIACETLSRDIIQREATGLFLACVTGDLPVDEFRRLFERFGHNDANLPRMSENHTYEDDRDYDKLVEHIHSFFAKTIDGGGGHMELEDHEVMPIFHVTDGQLKEQVLLGSSATGYVYKVRIESSHYTLTGHNQSLFALKTIHDRSESELATVPHLRKQRHPHIVDHIMSWRQKGITCILYPLATDNLRSYTRDTPSPGVSWPSVTWFLRQLSGLVSAVHHIHEQQEQDETFESYSTSFTKMMDKRSGYHQDLKPENTSILGQREGINSMYNRTSDDSNKTTKVASQRSRYHHDLKPENILIFEQREGINPVFKIKEDIHEASNLGGTASYVGPERNRDESGPFDTWTIGCVLTELLIWFLQHERLENFHRGRKQASTETPGFSYDHYWIQDGSERRLKRIVTDYLNEIKVTCRDDFERSLPAGALKDLPSTILSCFEINPWHRSTVEELHDNLQQMVDSAEIAGEEVEIEFDTHISP